MSFETPDQPQSLLTVKVADGAVKDVIWQAGNTLHSWGGDYFGRDPLVSVDADRWRIEASVREISGDGAAELKAMEIQAEIDCTSDESHHRDDPYQSVANGQYAPSPERKAQLEPLDALSAKTQSEVIIDGQAATVTKTSCDPSFVAKTNVRADLEIGGESASLSWDFTDPAVPKAVELRLAGNQLGWQHEKNVLPAHRGRGQSPRTARHGLFWCKDFEKFEPLFKQKHAELEQGTYSLTKFEGAQTIIPGAFFILRGVMAFIAEVGESEMKSLKHKDQRKERLRVVFENGTESAMYRQSFAARMGEQGGFAVTRTGFDVLSLIHISEPTRRPG